MRDLKILFLAGLLLLAGACRDGTLVDIEDYTDPESVRLRTSRPPELSDVQLPDSLFMTVGGIVLFLDVLSMFRHSESMTFSATSSDTTVVTAHILRRGGPTRRYTDQAIIRAVALGNATVSLIATEPPFDQLDRRPAYQRSASQSAMRTIAVKVVRELPPPP